MKEVLKKIMAEFWDRKPEYIQRRRVPEDLIKGKHSFVIIGPRRAGKSYTIYEMRDMLPNDFIYVNFEDERLAEFTNKDFDLILEAYHEMREEKPIIFLDEIQNVDNWARFIRRLADGGYKVVTTGSNSKMLSKEIAEKLGGRFPEVDIHPLDFAEFLKFKGIQIKKEHFYSKERFKIKKYFNEYLSYGGFPEISTLSKKESKIKLLRSYFNLVFYRDLMTRKDLKNAPALRFIIKKLREGIGNVLTPRSIYASLKNAGIHVGPNTVEGYIDYLEEAFLVIPCQPFAKSVLKQERRKRYFIDNGYIKILEVKEDKNLLLENLVFTELLKKGKKTNFHQGKRECDFIIDGTEALQVTYELTEGNEKREIDGLLEAMEAYNIKKGRIITYDQEKEIQKNGKKIHITPVWKWCLSL
ncbi:ATP-binding protein [Candidatus Micrarchaeota archaeon]|nr:ATP-binding protein [Candidatus Micrarchaeota archaeon]